jgi:tRNA(Arg) A34 adenosine deaminase TadA
MVRLHACRAADLGPSTAKGTLAISERVLGEGTSSVIELLDPSAHAEVMALRDAAQKLRSRLMPGSVLYSSSEPCPLPPGLLGDRVEHVFHACSVQASMKESGLS